MKVRKNCVQCTEVTNEVFERIFSVMSTLYCNDHMGVMELSLNFHRCNQDKKEVIGLVFLLHPLHNIG